MAVEGLFSLLSLKLKENLSFKDRRENLGKFGFQQLRKQVQHNFKSPLPMDLSIGKPNPRAGKAQLTNAVPGVPKGSPTATAHIHRVFTVHIINLR